MMTGFGMGFGLLGLLLMVLFWVVLIAVAVWVVRSVFPRGQQGSKLSTEDKQNARDILDKRYARGEITRDEYDLIKQDIA